ncbi:MAG TPA: DUF4345 family protein [Planctomycetota bacterium]
MDGKLLVQISGAVALGMGVVAMLAPGFVADFLDLLPQTTAAHGEIRASLGGVWAAMGLVVLGGMSTGKGRTMARGVGVVWGGAVAGRVLSLVLDDLVAPLTWLSIAVETALVVALFRGLGQLEREAAAKIESAPGTA